MDEDELIEGAPTDSPVVADGGAASSSNFGPIQQSIVAIQAQVDDLIDQLQQPDTTKKKAAQLKQLIKALLKQQKKLKAAAVKEAKQAAAVAKANAKADAKVAVQEAKSAGKVGAAEAEANAPDPFGDLLASQGGLAGLAGAGEVFDFGDLSADGAELPSLGGGAALAQSQKAAAVPPRMVLIGGGLLVAFLVVRRLRRRRK